MTAPLAKTYLIGGGIASMAAAAFLIRDAGVAGHDITILEERGVMGGSLDGAGSPETGYSLRGGRMFESKYLCTFALFDSIPTLDGQQTVTQEILQWNRTMPTSSHSRLFRHGQRQTAPKFGLSERHILAIERLVLEPEPLLGHTSISDQFSADFFTTDFWFMWCTTFAFQPWHSAVEFKRYLTRFAHMVAGFDRLEGIMRTVFNQYDSLVRPLQKWLHDHGVNVVLNARVTALQFGARNGAVTVEGITFSKGSGEITMPVGYDDFVMVTLGSMTDASSLGGMDKAPALLGNGEGSAWALWEKLAAGRPAFGRPAAFSGHIDESKWVSFTTTMHDPALLRLVHEKTGDAPGAGGLITFPDSNWLASIVIPFQPHFISQPRDVSVLWGYGLAVDKPGNFVGKPMSACTGREIMTEILGHLGIANEAAEILSSCTCIPCMMPFITSQFLPREAGDRPAVVPAGTHHLAFLGQFCEIPEDVVFTVEYSIRSAQEAVYALHDLPRKPPAVYHGAFDPRVLYKAFLALHDIAL